MGRAICFARLGILALALSGFAPAIMAAECGDTAGSGGTRIACMCGDSVVTDTRLEADDPVVTEVCGDVGLLIPQDSTVLDCDGARLRGSPADDPFDFNGAGVVVQGNRVVVQRCHISGFASGIRIGPGWKGNRILANEVMNNVLFGIYLNSRSSDHEVINNIAYDNREVGIQVNSLSNGVRIIGNTTSGHPIAGIQVFLGASHDEVILNKVYGRNKADGMADRGIHFALLAERNHVASNVVKDSSLGIDFGADAQRNAVTGNSVVGTERAGIRFGQGGEKNRVTENNVSDNRGEGIRVEQRSTSNLLRHNFVFANDDVGIKVCGVDNRLVRNEARFNVEWDICAVAGNFNIRNPVTFSCPQSPDCEPLLPPEIGSVVDAMEQ